MNERELKRQAAQIFLKAAEYIRQHGWQVSGMSVHGQPRCSMGALESAHPKLRWEKDLSSLMYDTLYKELNGISLTQFNYKYKSGEKVAELFERTAASLAQPASLVGGGRCVDMDALYIVQKLLQTTQ
jgi:hypothetical protein